MRETRPPYPSPDAKGYPGDYYPVYAPMENEGDSLSLARVQRFFRFLRRFWWLPILTTVIAAGAAAAFISITPPTYVSKARMWETEKLRLPEGAAFTGDTANYYGTQVELLRSVKLQQMVLNRLQASRTNVIPTGEDNKPLPVKLQVAQAPKSTIFAIEASCSNPEYAQSYLNALTVEYVEYRRNIRKLISGDTLASISEQVLRMERDLKADQEALTAFEQTNNLAILQEEGTIAGGYLARLKTQISDLKLESQLLEAASAEHDLPDVGRTNIGGFLADSLRSANASSSNSGGDRLSALREVELLKSQRERLSKYLRPKHPKIIKLDRDIARAQELIVIYRSQTAEQLAAARQATVMKTDSVLEAIKEWEGKVMESSARLAQAGRLKLNINRTQAIYDRLVTLVQNVDISRNIDQETLSILDTASPALRTYRFEQALFGLAVFAGIAIALLIILLVDVSDDRLTSMAEVTYNLNAEILGQVPELRARRSGTLPLLLAQDKRHMYAESFRNIRSALLYFGTEETRPRVVLITSSVPDEGKSTITANLAHALAFGGARVLVLDADLRKGSLQKMMGMNAEPGLTELIQNPSRTDVIQTNSIPNLSFISAGAPNMHPGDAFLSPAMEQLLVRWRKEYDFILIDSSPVFAADDATTLAPKIDGVLFVVRSRFSRAKVVRVALELLRQRSAKVLGLIYNRADSSQRANYYYYKYEEYYGNKRAEEEKQKAESTQKQS